MDNPTAFPVNTANEGGPGAYPAEPGMLLRDWFAGRIAAALCSATDSTGMWMAPCDDAGVRIVAERAYAVADAMLAARTNGGSL